MNHNRNPGIYYAVWLLLNDSEKRAINAAALAQIQHLAIDKRSSSIGLIRLIKHYKYSFLEYANDLKEQQEIKRRYELSQLK